MITIKSQREIEIMRASGLVLAKVHKAVRESIRPGITPIELDKIAEEVALSYNTIPAFKGYQGFPATLCVSVNDRVVHGIPDNTPLKDGDIISIDGGVILDGYYSDAARTYLVGNVDEKIKKLVDVTRESFYVGLKECYVGNRVSNIGHAIENFIKPYGYGIVRELVGHGVGLNLHEEPEIPNYGPKDRGPRLQEGMVIAVEPMINLGTHEVVTLDDGWTIVTADGLPSSHHENTIAITKDGPVLLTVLEDGHE